MNRNKGTFSPDQNMTQTLCNEFQCRVQWHTESSCGESPQKATHLDWASLGSSSVSVAEKERFFFSRQRNLAACTCLLVWIVNMHAYKHQTSRSRLQTTTRLRHMKESQGFSDTNRWTTWERSQVHGLSRRRRNTSVCLAVDVLLLCQMKTISGQKCNPSTCYE